MRSPSRSARASTKTSRAIRSRARRVPHQPRVEGLSREHGQDDGATKRERPDPGLDRDHRAERDERPEQRLHEDVDHRPASDKAYDMVEPGAVAQPPGAAGLD